MNSILTKLMSNRSFQDGAAIMRGVWRVMDAMTNKHQVEENVNKIQIDQIQSINKTKQKIVINIIQPAQTINTHKQQGHDSQKITPVQQQKIKSKAVQINYRSQLQNLKHTHSNLNTHPIVNFKQPPVAKKVPKSSTSRAYELSKLGVNLAGSAFSSYVQKKLGFKDKTEPTVLTKDNAKMITQTLCRMRGAPLKLAQALSIQQDKLIPKQIREAFQRARDQAYIIPLEEVQYMMVKSFGQDYKQKYFDYFNQRPFAASSIGQVHQGRLKNGKKVAIKIQYPNVKQSIDNDLQNIKFFLGYTGLLPATLFLDKIIANTRLQLMQQCDYKTQASKQIIYKENMKYQDKFYVPQVIDQLSSQDVLTCQFIEGVSMNGLQQFPQEIRDEIGQRIMSLTFYELFIYNFMQTDPNPSNFFYDVDKDRLNLIDFGAARSYDKNFIDYYWQVIKGAVQQDDNIIWQASIKMGFVTGQQNQIMKKAHIDSIKIVGEPWKYKGKFDFGSQNLTGRIYKTLPLMLKNRLRPPPQQVYSLHRRLSGSYLLCIRLKSRVNTNRIFQQIKSVYNIASENVLNSK